MTRPNDGGDAGAVAQGAAALRVLALPRLAAGAALPGAEPLGSRRRPRIGASCGARRWA